MKSPLTALTALTAVACLALTGCSGSPKADNASATTASSSSAEPTTRTIKDHTGEEITIPAKITRVAIDQIPIESTYLSYFDGHAPNLVAMAESRVKSLEKTIAKEMAPEMFQVETSYYDKGELNIEGLLKIKPDVVFYNAFNKKHGEMFKQAGIPAVGFSTMDAPSTTYAQWLKLLEEVFNEPGKTDAKIAAGTTLVKDAQERTAKVDASARKSTAVLMSAAGGKLALAGGKDGWFTNEWAKTLNYVNVTENEKNDSRMAATFEQLLTWNPDVLLVTGKGMSSMTAKTVLDNKVEGLDFSPLKSSKDKAVYSTDLGMWNWFTPNPDSPVVTQWLGKTLYPEQFNDVDLVKMTKDYYKTMYSFDLSDAQAQKIVYPDAQS